MIQLKAADGSFELSGSGNKLSLLGKAIRHNQLTIESPGEYETGGIEIIYGYSAALIIWEHLQLVYVFGDDRPTDFEKNQFSPCDGLIVATKPEKIKLNQLIETYDPRLIIIPERFADGTPAEASHTQESLKLNPQNLPMENREFIKLK